MSLNCVPYITQYCKAPPSVNSFCSVIADVPSRYACVKSQDHSYNLIFKCVYMNDVGID